jgi:hypothetical protein
MLSYINAAFIFPSSTTYLKTFDSEQHQDNGSTPRSLFVAVAVNF